jgi:5-methylcytosine-specific restriction endonuclease McrA
MDAQLRRLIRDRAGNRCEYCLIPQSAVKMPLQAEHVIALQHQGASLEENLALACDRCNLYKGTNLSAIDPKDGTIVGLFNPRKDRWKDSFLDRSGNHCRNYARWASNREIVAVQC